MLRRGNIIILLYIDDCAIAALTNAEIDEACDMLKKAYNLKAIGPINEYLGF